MKRALVALARKLGLRILHDSPDPVLRNLLAAHGALRLSQDAPALWDHTLSRLASEQKLRHLLHHFSIDLVVDIGANRGQFAQSLRCLGYAGEIVSFEPITRHCDELAEACRADGCWTVHRCAIGAVEATLPLNVYADSQFSSLHRVNTAGTAEFASFTEIDHVETVPVRPLDALWPEITGGRTRRVLIKTDTQGHERDVLAGATKSLAAAHVLLTEAAIIPIYEDAARFDELAALLAQQSYKLSALFPISFRAADLALIELDCFFVRTAPAAPTPA